MGRAPPRCREAHEVLEVRQEALQLAGVSAEEAARLHVVAEMIREKLLAESMHRQKLQ
jgi:hypothetical protein